jgi:hypothetical protein
MLGSRRLSCGEYEEDGGGHRGEAAEQVALRLRVVGMVLAHSIALVVSARDEPANRADAATGFRVEECGDADIWDAVRCATD